jgi:hypothetical protein
MSFGSFFDFKEILYKKRKQTQNKIGMFKYKAQKSVFIQLKCSSKTIQLITTCIVFKNPYLLLNFVIKATFITDFIIQYYELQSF